MSEPAYRAMGARIAAAMKHARTSTNAISRSIFDAKVAGLLLGAFFKKNHPFFTFHSV